MNIILSVNPTAGLMGLLFLVGAAGLDPHAIYRYVPVRHVPGANSVVGSRSADLRVQIFLPYLGIKKDIPRMASLHVQVLAADPFTGFSHSQTQNPEIIFLLQIIRLASHSDSLAA